jgi:hypothetical protein
LARKNRKSQINIFYVIFILILFHSCKTTPDTTLENSGFIPLDTNALAYILIDVKQARPILALLPVELFKDKQTRKMIDKTSFFTAALFPKESTRLFQAVGWGNYPAFRAGMAFRFSRHWKKPAKETYWYSSINNISVVLNSRQTFIGSSSANPAASAPGTEIPEGFSEFNRQSPVSCWIENPAPLLSGIIRGAGIPMQIPVRQLFINLYPEAGNQCTALIRMKFENTAQARGMLALFNLAGNFSSDSILVKLLFSNPPVQNGNNIDIKTASMNERDISLLFEMIYIYLN